MCQNSIQNDIGSGLQKIWVQALIWSPFAIFESHVVDLYYFNNDDDDDDDDDNNNNNNLFQVLVSQEQIPVQFILYMLNGPPVTALRHMLLFLSGLIQCYQCDL